jgi:hypothetical protein
MRKKSSGIKRLIENAWKAQGVRKELTDGKRRYDFQAVHGFRKYYKSRCEMSGMKPAVIETCMGHSLGVSERNVRGEWKQELCYCYSEKGGYSVEA